MRGISMDQACLPKRPLLAPPLALWLINCFFPVASCTMTHEGYGLAYQQGFRRTVCLVRSLGGSWANAEDVAQAAWLRGWEQRHQLRDERKIVSWVNAIAVNEHRRVSQDDARYQTMPELCGETEIDLAAIDAARILMLCRPRDRVLFEQQMDGLTNEEIAGRQGVSTTAIRVRLLRARRAARLHIETRGFELRSMARSQESAATSA
jgi:DNA-directed RNA polymerase specialized sigma24 family protein